MKISIGGISSNDTQGHKINVASSCLKISTAAASVELSHKLNYRHIFSLPVSEKFYLQLWNRDGFFSRNMNGKQTIPPLAIIGSSLAAIPLPLLIGGAAIVALAVWLLPNKKRRKRRLTLRKTETPAQSRPRRNQHRLQFRLFPSRHFRRRSINLCPPLFRLLTACRLNKQAKGGQ